MCAYERIFSSGPSPPPPPSASPLSSNYSADLLSENISHGSKIATPSEFGASIQVARSSSFLYGRALTPAGAISSSSIVVATPYKRRLITSGAGNGNVNTPASPGHLSPKDLLSSGDIHQRNLLHPMRHGAHVSSTVANETSAHSIVPPSIPYEMSDTASHFVYHASSHVVSAEDCDDSPSLETRLTQWIMQAWLICPDVHYLFIEDLLALGQEVSRNNTRDFNNRRIVLTCSLLRHCAEQNYNRDVTVQSRMLPYDEHNVTAVLPRIISWLYTLEPQVSLTAFVDLLGLTQLEQRMLSCKDGSEKDYKEYGRGRMHCKSRLCASKSTREKERSEYQNASGEKTINVSDKVVLGAIRCEKCGKVCLVLSIYSYSFTTRLYTRYHKTIQKPEEQCISHSRLEHHLRLFLTRFSNPRSLLFPPSHSLDRVG